MLIRVSCWLLLGVATRAFAQIPEPVISYYVANRFRPLPPEQEKVAGLIASRMRANTEGYLEHPDESALFPNEAQKDVKSNNAPPAVGRYVAAAVSDYQYSRDPALRSTLDRVAKRLISSPIPTTVAGRSDRLYGLISYYELTGGAEVLDAARLAANALAKATDSAASSYAVLPSPVESLAGAYRYTGELKYLERSKAIADSWVKENHPPMRATVGNLAALSGLLELYRTTGDDHYYHAALAGWDDLRANHVTATGGVLINDLAHPQTDDVGATALWFQITNKLLQITGNARFADALESTAYNELFAAQDARTGRIYSSVPQNGKRGGYSSVYAPEMSRAIASLPFVTWGRYGNGVAVALYTAGRSTVRLRRRRGNILIYTEGNFPEAGELSLHVEPGRNIQFPLRLRVPSWCTKFIVDIGGNHYIGTPGDFLLITREWRRGDTLKISVDMATREIAGQGPFAGYSALARGPQILAVSNTLNPGLGKLGAAAAALRPGLKLDASDNKIPANWAGDQVYSVRVEYDGAARTVFFVPFADAMDCRVWLYKSEALKGTTSATYSGNSLLALDQ